MSPAHHQIHHSNSVEHFDRNFGSSLAVFDWLFGTLHVPAKEREKLTFGVERDGSDPHSVSGALAAPFVRAAAQLQNRSRVLFRLVRPAIPRDVGAK